MVSTRVVPQLVVLLLDCKEEEVIANVLQNLAYLSTIKEVSHDPYLTSNGIPKIVQLLRSERRDLQTRACMCLANMSNNLTDETLHKFRKENLISALLYTLRHSHNSEAHFYAKR